ncbi:ABC transporter ATP-binding protein [Kineococcus sp. SYSU DK003]|uniref:ABC transporter ATP-binding protein n=1 Tax=Kineococcus sp. SYSU DK003 TaxID=3383124 RepID=UPI003D7D5BD2
MIPAPLLQVRDLHVVYSAGNRRTHAVRGVDLDVLEGEALGIVGESGSGKSTLARAMSGLETWRSGTIHYRGAPLPSSGRLPRDVRLDLQMVFQDPASALNPRRRIGAAIAAAVVARHGRRPSRTELEELLADVGLPPAFVDRYPRQASGGQLQRVVIARALAAEPRVLLADEPVSALDVTVQAQVLDLLADLREQRGLTVVMVSHDLAVIRHVCDRVAVVQHGLVVESGPVDEVIGNPQHPYTRELLAAVPEPVVADRT